MPNALAWLRELISEKEIPDGIVDNRSIREVQPADLAGYGNAIVPQVAQIFIQTASLI